MGDIKKANLLYREKKYHEALTIYSRIKEEIPELGHVVDASIALCNKKMGDDLKYNSFNDINS
jgi:hypothetical protein